MQIPGQPPSLLNPPPGCRFHPRCSYTMDVCRTEVPELVPFGSGSHLQRCWLDDATKERESVRTVASLQQEAS